MTLNKRLAIAGLSALLGGLGCFGLTAPPAAADPPGGQGFVPIFADEFSGSSLDTKAWGYNYPWGTYHNGWANMQPDHVLFGNGMVDLQATHVRTISNPWGIWDNINNKYINLEYTSGTIYSKQRWRYGYFEGSFIVPYQDSAWPAFWFLQDGWPPELDVFEFHGGHTQENFTYHYATSGGNGSWGGVASTGDAHAAWHTFGVDWEPDHIAWYVDGKQVARDTDSASISQMGPMYMLLDNQIGGWSPDPDPTQYGPTWGADFQIDWVRVWQKNAAGPANGTYRLTPQSQPGMAVELANAGSGAGNGTPVDIKPAVYDNAGSIGGNQKWALTRQSDGSYLLGAFPGAGSNLVLDTSGGGMGNGNTVFAWAGNGGGNQRWFLLDTGGGWYRLIPQAAAGQTVDLVGGAAAGAGATTQLMNYQNAASELFRLDPTTVPAMTVSNIAVSPPSVNQATVGWTTSNAADTTVRYGLSSAYGSAATGPGGASAHSVTLTGLQPFTTYHYQVVSTSVYGQTVAGPDQTFTTPSTAGPRLAVSNAVAQTATGQTRVTVTLANIGGSATTGVKITAATLGASGCLTALPLTVGIVPAMGTTTTTLSFPAQTSGQSLLLKVSATSSAGTLGSSTRLTVP